METQLFVEKLAQLLEIHPKDLKFNINLNQFHNWDSLTTVSTIALIDQYFSKLIGWEEINKCKTVNDIISLIQVN